MPLTREVAELVLYLRIGSETSAAEITCGIDFIAFPILALVRPHCQYV
jgi:hypothetical protein